MKPIKTEASEEQKERVRQLQRREKVRQKEDKMRRSSVKKSRSFKGFD
jgi:peptidyl-tRNA hydrolase ICT1